MLKLIIIFSFLLSITFPMKSQTNLQHDTSINKSSKVTIKKDYRIDKIVDTHKKSFKEEGFRIQIFSENKKQPARDAKAKYISLKHSPKAHEVYQQPYFKIRVGDFRTKLEALKFQKEISPHFPNCFIVKDEIDIEELLEN
ncbi:MAG: SPOR domain-containing protein [Flavobacteriales bacterium]|nr:SPOR domain-containing protein [Flavobacteriales bacterium]